MRHLWTAKYRQRFCKAALCEGYSLCEGYWLCEGYSRSGSDSADAQVKWAQKVRLSLFDRSQARLKAVTVLAVSKLQKPEKGVKI